MALVPNAIHVLCLLLIFGQNLAPSCMADVYRNSLRRGETLKATEALTSQNYTFVMQAYCNLVLYNDATAMWSSNTGGKGYNCYIKMEKDGNVILYSGDARILWETNTSSDEGDYVLVLRNDGNAVIYGQSRWGASWVRFNPDEAIDDESQLSIGEMPKPNNVLYPGQTLQTGQSLRLGDYSLTMQPDCNLEFMDSVHDIWSSKTNDKGSGCNLDFGMDGNLVIYDDMNTRVWGTNFKTPVGSYIFLLQKSRKFAIYGPDLWSTSWDGLTRRYTAESMNGRISMATGNSIRDKARKLL